MTRDKLGRFVSVPTFTDEQLAEIRSLRYFDGLTGAQVAQIVGCSDSTIFKYAPGWPGKVPVAPLREAFLASPVSAIDVARELGWWHAKGPDSARVKRTLGVILERSNGCVYRRTTTDAETVRLIAEAIGISPWSVLPDDEDVAA